ncbi:MAG: ABC1 kinase family protein [Polyangiales bacterium]
MPARSGQGGFAWRRWRLLRAYIVALLVLGSYLRLGLMGRIFGRGYRRRRLPALHEKNARRVERAILALKGLFIKFGQLISILTNFLPPQFRAPLESLQDQIPPRPFTEIAARLHAELGGPPEERFADFQKEPLASASLGQVHRATLHDGRSVVVKVQHVGIEGAVRQDLRAIWRILIWVRHFVPIRGLERVFAQVREMVLRELDFSAEAAAMQRIGARLEDLPKVRIPAVIAELSTARVLTMSFEPGIKISALSHVPDWQLEGAALARTLIEAYARMIFEEGEYHADPHPGNILVNQRGELVLLDFGAIAHLSPAMRAGIPRFLQAVLQHDTERILAALAQMGFIARGRAGERAAERIVEYLHRRFQEDVRLDSFNLKDIRFDADRSLTHLIDLREQNIGLRELTSAFQVPKDWVLLERTLLLLTGVCTHLDPELNPFQLLRPHVEHYLFGDEPPLKRLASDMLRDAAVTAAALPKELSRLLHQASRGELFVATSEPWHSARLLYAGMRQRLWAQTALGCLGARMFSATDAAFAAWQKPLEWGAAAAGLLCLASMWRARQLGPHKER